ncbi:MAG: hypothetical protein RSD95_02830 [Clostridia bacterium]
MIEVRDIGAKSMDRAIKLLAGFGDGKALRDAVYHALSRAGKSAQTKAGQFSASKYTITKGTFMARTKSKVIIKQGGGLVSVNLRYAGSVIPLIEFSTRYGKDGNVTTQVMRDRGASALVRAFPARVYGPTRIFERIGSGRFPIEQKYGPSTAHMMQNEEVIAQMDETIRTTYETRIEHEITRILNGW